MKYAAASNMICCVSLRPMASAWRFAHLVVRYSTAAVPSATIQNGRVSLSRSGLPLRSQAHRDRT
jgi:hypothetical protein